MPINIPADERLDEEIRIRVTKTEKSFYDSLASSYSFKTGTLLRSILRRTAPDYTKNRFFQWSECSMNCHDSSRIRPIVQWHVPTSTWWRATTRKKHWSSLMTFMQCFIRKSTTTSSWSRSPTEQASSYECSEIYLDNKPSPRVKACSFNVFENSLIDVQKTFGFRIIIFIYPATFPKPFVHR